MICEVRDMKADVYDIGDTLATRELGESKGRQCGGCERCEMVDGEVDRGIGVVGRCS